MSTALAAEAPVVARLRRVTLEYGKKRALDNIDLDIPAGKMVGVIGPDGVGKSSLLSLIAGARAIQSGEITVLGGDMAQDSHRRKVCPEIAYMPQGLGKNLYSTLSVYENVDFFGGLFGLSAAERKRRITKLLQATGLLLFSDRPAGKLSGGMKQKLGLCCALIHDPDLLILDEPTTGVDPLSRRHFWELIEQIRVLNPEMSVLVATAYMEEASSFDWLVAMDDGCILSQGSPQDLLARTATTSLDDAFIALLPEAKRRDYQPVQITSLSAAGESLTAIKAEKLTKRFGDFVAVDEVSFNIEKGEIFGFIGSNGCGKTTTMKVLTGLLPASEGRALLFGQEVDPHDIEVRRRVGYMSQSFSLYNELTVRQNLDLHARLFQIPESQIHSRVAEVAIRFSLSDVLDYLPTALPLGVRQRLSLAVAVIHKPEILILDEPTSGVDPVARDALWQILIDLARQESVTIFISTHFMNEAERCDRISLMHEGRVLVTDSPDNVRKNRNAQTLEEAFISYLEEESKSTGVEQADQFLSKDEIRGKAGNDNISPYSQSSKLFDWHRSLSYAKREALEVRRDPIRATLALVGSVILMFVIGYGITFDVEKLSFAVLDNDQTTTSRQYVQDIAGSRYFVERAPLADYAEIDSRMRSGELSLALEIPAGFARRLARTGEGQIGGWIDGGMPTRAESAIGYVQGMHAHWLTEQMRQRYGDAAIKGDVNIETRFRYNPNVSSLVAIAPAVMPLLLLMIPAMLASLSIVREKELGSIINLYVTPVSKLEFLIGKQIPYIVLSMVSFFLLVSVALFVFEVPFTGSFITLVIGALVYVIIATSMGFFISAFLRSQTAAIFATSILTLIPAVQFSGLTTPVSSLQGIGAVIGKIYPTAHFVTISRGTFAKAMEFSDLTEAFIMMSIAIPVFMGLAVWFLKKQAD